MFNIDDDEILVVEVLESGEEEEAEADNYAIHFSPEEVKYLLSLV